MEIKVKYNSSYDEKFADAYLDAYMGGKDHKESTIEAIHSLAEEKNPFVERYISENFGDYNSFRNAKNVISIETDSNNGIITMNEQDRKQLEQEDYIEKALEENDVSAFTDYKEEKLNYDPDNYSDNLFKFAPKSAQQSVLNYIDGTSARNMNDVENWTDYKEEKSRQEDYEKDGVFNEQAAFSPSYLKNQPDTDDLIERYKSNQPREKNNSFESFFNEETPKKKDDSEESSEDGKRPLNYVKDVVVTPKDITVTYVVQDISSEKETRLEAFELLRQVINEVIERKR